MCLSETLHSAPAGLDRPADHTHFTLARRALLGGGLGAAAGALVAPTPATASSRARMRDLTWPLAVSCPVFFDALAASRRPLFTVEENGFYIQQWTISEHTATHLDAPGHFFADGRRAPDLALDELLVPTAVIDITGRVATDPDTEVTVDDLRAYERRYGTIPERALVVMYSGWETRAGSPEEYRGTDASGYHFPGWGAEAVRWLVDRRRISGVGVDTLSLDNGPSATFDAHRELLGSDRYGIENLRNVGTIPPRGAELFVGLVPWEEGSGGPCRVIARW
jgi:kynurenine formamidase